MLFSRWCFGFVHGHQHYQHLWTGLLVSAISPKAIKSALSYMLKSSFWPIVLHTKNIRGFTRGSFIPQADLYDPFKNRWWPSSPPKGRKRGFCVPEWAALLWSLFSHMTVQGEVKRKVPGSIMTLKGSFRTVHLGVNFMLWFLRNRNMACQIKVYHAFDTWKLCTFVLIQSFSFPPCSCNASSILLNQIIDNWILNTFFVYCKCTVSRITMLSLQSISIQFFEDHGNWFSQISCSI